MKAGFKLYDEFEDDFVFEYPRSWVARPNSLRKGVYIADFQVSTILMHREHTARYQIDRHTCLVAKAWEQSAVVMIRFGHYCQKLLLKLLAWLSPNRHGQPSCIANASSCINVAGGSCARLRSAWLLTCKRGQHTGTIMVSMCGL